MQDKKTEERESLIAMRTHLTRATLAAALLRRKYDDLPDVERLCNHITEAIANTEKELVALESSLMPREDRETSRSSHQKRRPTLTEIAHQKTAAP